jgi:C-terminal processing protease CtpA/Prc
MLAMSCGGGGEVEKKKEEDSVTTPPLRTPEGIRIPITSYFPKLDYTPGSPPSTWDHFALEACETFQEELNRSLDLHLTRKRSFFKKAYEFSYKLMIEDLKRIEDWDFKFAVDEKKLPRSIETPSSTCDEFLEMVPYPEERSRKNMIKYYGFVNTLFIKAFRPALQRLDPHSRSILLGLDSVPVYEAGLIFKKKPGYKYDEPVDRLEVADTLYISNEIDGIPLERAFNGEIKKGDFITRIKKYEKGEGKWVEIKGKTFTQIMELLTSYKKNVKVELEYERPETGKKGKVTGTLRKDFIDLQFYTDDKDLADGIGYLKLDEFWLVERKKKDSSPEKEKDRDEIEKRYAGAHTLIPTYLETMVLKAKSISSGPGDVKGLILDLRDNPGGNNYVLQKIYSLFVPKSTPLGYMARYKEEEDVEEEGFESNRVLKADKDAKKFFSWPLVVLVSEQSASATEVLSGAFQQYGRALIISNAPATFGKGVGQRKVEVKNGSRRYPKDFYYWLTSHFIHLPNGKSYHGVGIHPDVYFESKDISKAREDWQNKRRLRYSQSSSSLIQMYGGIFHYEDYEMMFKKVFGGDGLYVIPKPPDMPEDELSMGFKGLDKVLQFQSIEKAKKEAKDIWDQVCPADAGLNKDCLREAATVFLKQEINSRP